MKDYELLRRLGIAVSRQGIPWPLVDKNGVYDFSIIDPMIEAMKQTRSFRFGIYVTMATLMISIHSQMRLAIDLQPFDSALKRLNQKRNL